MIKNVKGDIWITSYSATYVDEKGEEHKIVFDEHFEREPIKPEHMFKRFLTHINGNKKSELEDPELWERIEKEIKDPYFWDGIHKREAEEPANEETKELQYELWSVLDRARRLARALGEDEMDALLAPMRRKMGIKSGIFGRVVKQIEKRIAEEIAKESEKGSDTKP